MQPPPLPLPPAQASLRYPNPNVTAAPANPTTSVLQSVKQAFASVSQTQPPPSKAPPYIQTNSRAQYPQAPGVAPDCLIPGCGKPVHVDENGLPASDYCSQRHRE